MLNKTIWVIITVIIALVMFFGNRKTRVTQILAAQLRVFRNAKTRKTSKISLSIGMRKLIARKSKQRLASEQANMDEEGHRHLVGAFIFLLAIS